MTASILPLIKNIHGAMDTDSLLTAIQESLMSLELGGQFAIFFCNQATGGTNLANARKLSESQIAACETAVQRGFPFNGLQRLNCDTEIPLICANLVFQEQTYGVLAIPSDFETRVQLSPLDAESFIHSISTALVKLQIFEEANRNNRISKTKIEAVNQVAELLSHLELDPLLASLLDISLDIMQAQVGSILLREQDGSLKSRTELGLREEFLLGLASVDGTPFIKGIVEQGQPVLIRDAATDDRLDLSNMPEHLQSIICLPLATLNNTLGVLVIINTDGNFESNDFDVLTTIGFLASAAIENALLRIEQVEADQVREQMHLARKIQENMQAKCVPQTDTFDLDGWCIPCDETGGDYFDFIDYRAGQLGVVVGDATGHGVAAALTMVAVRASLLSLLQLDYPLTDVFRFVSNRIEADGNTDRFMTLFCGLIDLNLKTMTYCSAGHDSPMLYRPSTDGLIELGATGIPLGTFPDWDYELCEDVRLETGDILVIATDGVREAFNSAGEAFGDERFRQIIRDSKGLSAAEISSKIRISVLNYIDPAPRTDDITVVVIVVR